LSMAACGHKTPLDFPEISLIFVGLELRSNTEATEAATR